MEKIVLYEKEKDIGIITLNKPEQRNTLDLVTLKTLIETFNKSAKNNDVCVIYTSKGKDFTVGANLKYGYELLTNKDKFPEAIAFLEAFQDLTRAMIAHPGIIIVGYHGWVIGGGFEHTICCDLKIATDDTKIMLPELNMGLFFGNLCTKLLPRMVGECRAREILYLGKEINAEEAYKIGLINHVCKKGSLTRILRKYANTITQKDHLGLRLTKKLLNENRESDNEAVLDRELMGMITTGQSEEVKRRINMFVRK
ncbi:MAG: enoyl-CoA hydratase/isomerase family protein [Candidatus Hermodarchaeota archaeon]